MNETAKNETAKEVINVIERITLRAIETKAMKCAECGKRPVWRDSKSLCRTCHYAKANKVARERRMERLTEAYRHIRAGKCPQCGSGLRRNNSLTGWYQCNALGAVGFQTGDGIGKAPCDFQFFFDPSEDERQEVWRREHPKEELQ